MTPADSVMILVQLEMMTKSDPIALQRRKVRGEDQGMLVLVLEGAAELSLLMLVKY